MSTITIDVSPEVARRLAEDPFALRRAAAVIEAVFADDSSFGAQETYVASAEEWALIEEGLDQVDVGKVKPYNREEIQQRSEELLKAAGIS